MDTPETLAAALLRAGAGAVGAAAAVVKKGAQNVKDDARANVQKSAPIHNGGAYKAITYDNPSIETAFGSPTVVSEIGYDKNNRLGRLGNLLEFGGGGDKSPPHRDLGRALDAEEPRFEAALAAAIVKLL